MRLDALDVAGTRPEGEAVQHVHGLLFGRQRRRMQDGCGSQRGGKNGKHEALGHGRMLRLLMERTS
jgi:hypothetical protein